MKIYKSIMLVVSSLTLLTIAVYAKFGNLKAEEAPITIESCVIVGSGRAPAIIKVWEEKADNTRGAELIKERWIQRDERIPISSERGRIIYDYKYRSDDSWKTDFHDWCHRGNDTKIP